MSGPSDAGPYSPVDSVPDADFSAGYASSIPPPPGQSFQHTVQPSYSEQPVPRGFQRAQPTYGTPAMESIKYGGKGLVLGLAGAAIVAATSSSVRTNAWFFARGAIGGMILCWLASRKAPGFGCSVAGLVGGYSAARWARKTS